MTSFPSRPPVAAAGSHWTVRLSLICESLESSFSWSRIVALFSFQLSLLCSRHPRFFAVLFQRILPLVGHCRLRQHRSQVSFRSPLSPMLPTKKKSPSLTSTPTSRPAFSRVLQQPVQERQQVARPAAKRQNGQDRRLEASQELKRSES